MQQSTVSPEQTITKFTCEFSEEVWDQTYKYHTDGCVSDSHMRVAKDLASCEKNSEEWTQKFYELLTDFKAVPGGRISSNAGTNLHGTTYINCFTESAKVLTNKGLLSIKDIRIGDKVLTHLGRWKNVSNVLWRQYNGTAIQISSPYASQDIVSTPEHPFYNGDGWVSASLIEKIALPYNHTEGKEMSVILFDYLDEGLLADIQTDGEHIWTSKNVIGGQGASRTQLSPKINARFILTKDIAYALGRYLGDGSCWQQFPKSSKYEKSGFNIVFNKNEQTELKAVKIVIENMFGLALNINKSGPRKDWFYIRKSNAIIATVLSNMFGDSSYNKKIPKFMWAASAEIQEAFVVGVWDADGTISSKGETKIALANHNLINELQTMCSLIKFPCAKRREAHIYEGASPTYILSCSSKGLSYKFRSLMQKKYSDDRKSLIASSIAGAFKTSISKVGASFTSDRISKSEIVIDEKVYNISVDDDESYVVNNVVVHNCFVDGPIGEDKDSIKGIFDALGRAALTLKSEGGYGFCCDFIRPRGAFIHGVGVETPGAVEMLGLWDKMSAVITKGSGQKKKNVSGKNKIRKGAMMVTMSVWHPDIEEFITSKSIENNLTKFNMSILCTNAFINAVRNDQDWNLIYPDTTHSEYKKVWDGNIDNWLNIGGPVKIHKTVKAKDLWELIMTSTYNRNEPGVLFIDRINELNNLYYNEFITATNPCVIKGTLVNTPYGYRKVEDIEINDMISTVRGSEPVKTIEIHNNIPVFKVCFSDGGEEVVTAAHMYHVLPKGKNHKKYIPTRLDGINIGDMVRVHPAPLISIGDETEYKRGLAIGVLLGDGCITEDCISKKIAKIASNQGDQAYNELLVRLFTSLGYSFNAPDISRDSKSMNLIIKNGDLLVKDLGLDVGYSFDKNYDVTKVSSTNMAIGIIDGLLATDGNINLKTNHPQIRICTTSNDMAKMVRQLLLMIGSHGKIYSSFMDDGGIINGRKITRKHIKYNIIVNSSSLIALVDKSRLIELHPSKGAAIISIKDNWALTGGNWRASVVSIKPVGSAQVYDLYCQGSDTWITSGYVQRGCGEQLLPIGGVCLLGSINLTQFINNERTDWNYEKLKYFIPIFVRMLDNVNDKTNVPLPEQAWNLKNKRRIGMGYLGYGSALYLMKTRYGSPQALKLTENLARYCTNMAYSASAMLAAEKGSFPLFDSDKYLNSNFVKQALDEDTISLIRKHGIRNSHLTSIQPTGNSSIYANNISSGLEPVVSAEYYRTSIVQVPPDGLELPKINWASRTFTESGNIKWSWIKEGDEDILAADHNGTLFKIDANRGLTKESHVEDYSVSILKSKSEWEPLAAWAANIFNLTIKEHIDVMKVFAKYIDSAMSKTINIPNDYPYNEFKNLYMDMFDSGVIKGGTTYRHGTMATVVSADKTMIHDSNGRPKKIKDTHAPKRPVSLPCDIHLPIIKGEKWVALVGLLDNRPYELFVGKAEQLELPTKYKTGCIVKIKQGVYNLSTGSGEDELIVKNIVKVFDNQEMAWATRMISTSLRHGVSPMMVVSQLEKGTDLGSINKVLSRILKKYIPDGQEVSISAKCSTCESSNLIYMEGCMMCKNCGNSRCN